MIAAAIVCAAVVSQAASLNWATWGYTGDDPDADGALLNGSSAYLVMVTDAANFAVSDDLKTITGGSIVDTTKFEEGVIAGVWNTELADGKYLFAIIGTTAGDGLPVPTTGKYGIDYNGANETSSGFYEVDWSAATGGGFAFDEENYGGLAANTAVSAVPEPTSGLLLLLGVAGLALKRRRA